MEQISLDELLALTQQDKINRKPYVAPLKNISSRRESRAEQSWYISSWILVP